MEDLLISKYLYQITIGIDRTPLDNERFVKLLNHNVEAKGLIGISIYMDLKFHIQPLITHKKHG
jgi:hypothetical protein